MAWIANLDSVDERKDTVQVQITYRDGDRTIVKDYNIHRTGEDIRRVIKQITRDKIQELRDIDTERTDLVTRIGTDPRDWNLG